MRIGINQNQMSEIQKSPKTQGLILTFNPKNKAVSSKFINFLKSSSDGVRKDMDSFMENLINRFDNDDTLDKDTQGLVGSLQVSFDYEDEPSKFTTIDLAVYSVEQNEQGVTHEIRINDFNELTLDEFLDKINETKSKTLSGF